jgi:beta-glucanase (GH16 family)
MRLYKKYILVASLNILFNSLNCQINHPSNDPNWVLIFNENFNTLNRTIWNVIDDSRANVGFGEASFRDNNNNVQIQNGILRLTANNQSYLGANYTGGMLRSIQTFNRNTFIESRIRLRTIPGSFPAFWLWRGNGGCQTNDYNEIDIMEHFGCWSNHNQSGIHYCINGQRANYPINVQTPHLQWTEANISNNQYHTYAAFWQRENIHFYIDESKTHIINNLRPNNTPIIQFPMPIILNQSIGNASCVPNGGFVAPNPNNFPITLETDWVRVYQLNCDRNTVITQIPNFNTFNWAVKRSYSLSNTTTVPTNFNVSLMARDFIDLNNGFEIPNNTNFSITTIDCQ